MYIIYTRYKYTINYTQNKCTTENFGSFYSLECFVSFCFIFIFCLFVCFKEYIFAFFFFLLSVRNTFIPWGAFRNGRSFPKSIRYAHPHNHHFYGWQMAENPEQVYVLCLFIDANWITCVESVKSERKFCPFEPYSFVLVDFFFVLMLFSAFWVFQSFKRNYSLIYNDAIATSILS